jgi:hypothetical protein
VQRKAGMLTGRVHEAEERINQAKRELDDAAWYEKASKTCMIYPGLVDTNVPPSGVPSRSSRGRTLRNKMRPGTKLRDRLSNLPTPVGHRPARALALGIRCGYQQRL